MPAVPVGVESIKEAAFLRLMLRRLQAYVLKKEKDKLHQTMKKHILHTAWVVLLAACSSQPDVNSTNLASGAKDTIPETTIPDTHGIGSQFYVTYPDVVYFLSPGKKIDFRNFSYSDYKLRNGVYVENEPGSIDSLSWKATHRISDSLYLVELYHLYGGASSEQEQLFYLYKKGDKKLTLTSKLYFSGNLDAKVSDREMVLRAEHYAPEDARCCPSEIETGYFTIKDGRMVHLRSEFSKNLQASN